MVSQEQRILSYLKTHKGITQLDAYKYLGIVRLPSRIFDLKRKGYAIEDEFIDVENRFKEKCRVKKYYLKGETKC